MVVLSYICPRLGIDSSNMTVLTGVDTFGLRVTITCYAQQHALRHSLAHWSQRAKRGHSRTTFPSPFPHSNVLFQTLSQPTSFSDGPCASVGRGASSSDACITNLASLQHYNITMSQTSLIEPIPTSHHQEYGVRPPVLPPSTTTYNLHDPAHSHVPLAC